MLLQKKIKKNEEEYLEFSIIEINKILLNKYLN